MGRTGPGSAFLSGVICAALLVLLAIAGCNNTCVSFTSNPSPGTLTIGVSDSKPTHQGKRDRAGAGRRPSNAGPIDRSLERQAHLHKCP